MEMNHIKSVVKGYIETGNNPKSLVSIAKQIDRDRKFPSKLNEVTTTLVTAVNQLYGHTFGEGFSGSEEGHPHEQRTRAVTGLGLIAVSLAGSSAFENRMATLWEDNSPSKFLSVLASPSFAQSAAPLHLKSEYHSGALEDAVNAYRQVAFQYLRLMTGKLILRADELSFAPHQANDAQREIQIMKDTLLPTSIRDGHPYRLINEELSFLSDSIGQEGKAPDRLLPGTYLHNLKREYANGARWSNLVSAWKVGSAYALAQVTGDWSDLSNNGQESIEILQEKPAGLNDSLCAFWVLGSHQYLRGHNVHQLLFPKRDEIFPLLNPFLQR